MTRNVDRFADRVENYRRYRPNYPRSLLRVLEAKCGLKPTHHVVDVGAGTGLLSQLFLAYGNSVTMVEPNQDMRRAAEETLASEYHDLTVLDGSAEQIPLPNRCADLVTAGQAFHWFEAEASLSEFARISRPGSSTVLVWNQRDTSQPVMRDYEALVRDVSDEYKRQAHLEGPALSLHEFLLDLGFWVWSTDHVQVLDRQGFHGRFLSTSYAPDKGHELYDEALQSLDRIFDIHQRQDKVGFAYTTRAYGKALDPVVSPFAVRS